MSQSIQLPIASIGLDEANSLCLASMIKILEDQVDHTCVYEGNTDVFYIIRRSSRGGRYVVLIDCDTRSGRLAWHSLRAQQANIILVALTSDIHHASTGYVLTKPLQWEAILDLIKGLSQSNLTESSVAA